MFAGRQDEVGHEALVRIGYHPARKIQTSVGPATVQMPKVRSRDEELVSFRSTLMTWSVRKTASLAAALP